MLASEGVKVCIRIYIASGNARECHRALIQKGKKRWEKTNQGICMEDERGMF